MLVKLLVELLGELPVVIRLLLVCGKLIVAPVAIDCKSFLISLRILSSRVSLAAGLKCTRTS